MGVSEAKSEARIGKDNSFFVHKKVALSMGVYDPRDEDLHPEYMTANPSPDLTETQFFGFSVPEHGIHSCLYTWLHPNLNMFSSGVHVVQGRRLLPTAVDICDFRTYQSMNEIPVPKLSYKTSGGYEVEIIDPGRKYRTKYLDHERNSSFDIIHTALHAPCVWSSNRHYEQVMHTEGEVVLRGQRYDVNARHIRDRSWGEARGIGPANIPPVGWITGSFDDGLAFHITAYDSPDLDPIWKGHFDIAEEDVLRFGWVIIDGQQAAVRKIRKLTRYDQHLVPIGMDLELIDEHGRTTAMTGKLNASFAFSPCHNARWMVCLFDWERPGVPGGTGYGDVQDGQWNDFLIAVT